MSYWVLPISCIPVSYNMLQLLTKLERKTDKWITMMMEFDGTSNEKISASSSDMNIMLVSTSKEKILDLDDKDPKFIVEFSSEIEYKTTNYAVEEEQNVQHMPVDPYLNMQLDLPHESDDRLQYYKVEKIVINLEGRIFGVAANDNLLIDSRQNKLEILDGETEILIAHNILAQVDQEGHWQMIMADIEEHIVVDDSIPIEEVIRETKSMNKSRFGTTCSWKLCVKCKDGSSNWIFLKDLKESYPVQFAYHAISNLIKTEPSFARWFHIVTRKKNACISNLKSKYWQRTHKYGTRVPRSADKSKKINEDNWYKKWTDII